MIYILKTQVNKQEQVETAQINQLYIPRLQQVLFVIEKRKTTFGSNDSQY